MFSALKLPNVFSYFVSECYSKSKPFRLEHVAIAVAPYSLRWKENIFEIPNKSKFFELLHTFWGMC